jgi:hypothetical protein
LSGPIPLKWHIGYKIIDHRSAVILVGAADQNSPIVFSANPLQNKSIKTTNAGMEERHMSEVNDMIETAELLVEIDLKIAKHGGRFGSEVTCDKHFEGVTFNEHLHPMGDDAFSKGEVLRPYGLTMNAGGKITFVMEVVAEDTLYRYVGLNLDQLEDSFPSVSEEIRHIIFHATTTGLSPAQFIVGLQNRLHGKPALINLVQDYLKNGRNLITDLQGQQDDQDAAGFYEKADGYGTM